MKQFKIFWGKIQQIQPYAQNIFGSGIPSGVSPAHRGGSTESDVIRELHQSVHRLGNAFSNRAEEQVVNDESQKVENLLKTCRVLGLIDDNQLEDLLHDLELINKEGLKK